MNPRRTRTAAVPEKYEHIDFKPPQSVADAAEKGLEYRAKASPSNKGGLTPAEAAKQGIGSGVQRAVNLKNRDNTSPEVIKQMAAFFSRHEKNKGVSPEHKGDPWNDKGNVAWLIWGGDPGRAWAEKVKNQMEIADEKAMKKAAEHDLEDLTPATQYQSPLQVIEAELMVLESLWSDVQAVLDAYEETVPMPVVGRIAAADLALHSQTEVFAKCEHAMRHAERVINMCRTQLQLNPSNAKVSSFLRDSQTLYGRFSEGRAAAREVLSAMSQKIVPSALEGIVTEAVDAVKAVTRYPNSVTVKVHARMAPVNLNNGVVEAQVFDAYVTVYPLPRDSSPEYQQFVFTQSTLGDTAVYLTVIDRTNEKSPAKPVKVTDGAGAAKKILGYLAGWDNLLSVHTTKMAAAKAVLTRPEVVKFLITELKKIPGAKVKYSKNSIVIRVPSALNPAVVGVEILNLNLDKALFRMTLKNGMTGWGWDAYRKPAPVFHGPHNTLNLGALDSYPNPEEALRNFVKIDLLPQIGKAGMVWNGKDLVPMPMSKTPAAPVAPPPPAPKVDYLAAITSALKGMKLGPVGGRIVNVDFYPGASPSWSVEPANRQRLDHYVGSGYRDDDDDDGDSEGWDSEAWEQDYAGPVSTAAYKWLATEFGPSLFYVEVGEKGHIDIQLTAEGRKKFLA